MASAGRSSELSVRTWDVLIAHLTDPHVRRPGEKMADRVPSDDLLVAAVSALLEMDKAPDLVVLTGDLVNDGDRPGGAPEQYRHLAEILRPLAQGPAAMPLLVVPGNHDDRAMIRTHLGPLMMGGMIDPAARPSDPLRFMIDNLSPHREGPPLRLIGLDTVVPGHHHGELGAAQLAWLADTLAAQPSTPTLVIQHHPPFATGIDHMDAMGLRDAAALEEVLAPHPQVLAVLCGHLHRSITARVGQTVAITAPSTAAHLALHLHGEGVAYSDEAPAMALHLWEPSDPFRLRSHVRAVDVGEVWAPAWAQRAARS